jgi:hypothetical protein
MSLSWAVARGAVPSERTTSAYLRRAGGRTLPSVIQRRLIPVVTALFLLVAFGGCSSDKELPVALDQATGGAGAVGAPDPRVGVAPKLIYTGDLVVRVDDIGKGASRATAVAADTGGVVFASESNLDGKNETRLTIKVPSERFQEALDRLSSLGRVLRRQAKAQDVTAEVVDLEGRLKTAQASADRLRALLAGASSPTDIVAVEGELAKREADIESMQGRLRVLNDQVDLSTITLTVTERSSLEVNDDVPGFLKSVRTGAVALANVALVLVAAAGFLLPFVPFLIVGWWLFRRYRRRHPRAQRPPRPPWPPNGGSPWTEPPSDPTPAAAATTGESSQ